MVLKGRIPQANYIKYSSCMPRKKNDVPTGQHPEIRAVPENNGSRQNLKKNQKRHIENNLDDCRLDKHQSAGWRASGPHLYYD